MRNYCVKDECKYIKWWDSPIAEGGRAPVAVFTQWVKEAS